MTTRRRAPTAAQPLASSCPASAPLLTLKQVAHELAVSLRQIQTWRASGRLHVLVFGTHCVRVEPTELERFKREARS